MRRPRREKLDWVVNTESYGQSVALTPASQWAFPLTFSDESKDLSLWGGEQTRESWAAVPEGSNQQTRAVRGTLFMTPSVWGVGSFISLFARITVANMDPIDGSMVVAANYSLAAARDANEPFCWQKLYYDNFVSGSPSANMMHVNASARRRLRDNEALWLVVENRAAAGTLNLICYMRTLMVSPYK